MSYQSIFGSSPWGALAAWIILLLPVIVAFTMGRPRSGFVGPLAILLLGLWFGFSGEFSTIVWAWVAACLVALLFVTQTRKSNPP
jgi:hypothetical protein